MTQTCGGVFKLCILGRSGRVLTFRKNISLGLSRDGYRLLLILLSILFGAKRYVKSCKFQVILITAEL